MNIEQEEIITKNYNMLKTREKDIIISAYEVNKIRFNSIGVLEKGLVKTKMYIYFRNSITSHIDSLAYYFTNDTLTKYEIVSLDSLIGWDAQKLYDGYYNRNLVGKWLTPLFWKGLGDGFKAPFKLIF
ncbi:MAG: hypothetical protein FJ264_18455, partial [Planctomycetes bacterium]|nr:hypothetical protein [Planctomycetota bacterium]